MQEVASGPVLIPERRGRIRDQVAQRGSVRIDELARSLGVSAWTIRRDLVELERSGALERVHGGAVDATRPALPPELRAAPDDAHAPAKERIAAVAAARLRDDSTIMMLAGSTTSAMVPHLAGRRLTVVTNGLEIAYGLRHAPHVSLVVVGGYLHAEQMTLLGPLSEAAMADMHVDLIVAGAYGVHPTIGVTGSKIVQAGYHHSMLRHADGLLVVADSSKLGRRGPTVLAATSAVTTLVTDDAAPPDVVADLRNAGVEVALA